MALLRTSELLHNIAFNILCERLAARGNNLSDAHRDGLSKMLTCFSKLALGEETGRWACSLAASLGKSQGIVSFIVAAHQLLPKLPASFSLTIAASRVEDLAEMYRACREAGVPESELGLAYSSRFTYDAKRAAEYLAGKEPTLPDGYVSEPATPDLSSRRFIFVTHQRLSLRPEGKSQQQRDNARERIALLSLYNGQRRALTLWDETFLRSEPWASTLMDLADITNLVKGRLDYSNDLADVSQYLSTCKERIEGAIKNGGTYGLTVDLPSLEPQTRQHMLRCLPANLGLREQIENFLTAAAYPIQVVDQQNGGGAMYAYTLRVPRELDPIVVLDASHEIRYLSKLDTTLRIWPGIPQDIKRYPDLRIYLTAYHTGRHTIEKALKFPSSSPLVKELIHTIQTTPDDGKKFLIITFTEDKAKRGNKRDGVLTKLKSALTAAGISASRYTLLTFGSETATSRYKDHPFVYFLGHLHLPTQVLRALIAGQQDKLDAKIPPAELEAAQLGEIVHSSYQGANRGTIRTVKNGIAAAETVWLSYKHPRKLRAELEPMFPDAQWPEWKTEYLAPIKSRECVRVVSEDIVPVIKEYLGSRPADIVSVSSREVKEYIEAQFGGFIADETYRRARLTVKVDGWTFPKGSHNFIRLQGDMAA
jgi:hypothetical protein